MSEVNTIILRADGNAEIAYVDNGLEAAQKTVGGYIEAITPDCDTGFGNWLAWVNEDGKSTRLPRNHIAETLLTKYGWRGDGDYLVGTIMLVGDGGADTVDVPDEVLVDVLAHFREHGTVET